MELKLPSFDKIPRNTDFSIFPPHFEIIVYISDISVLALEKLILCQRYICTTLMTDITPCDQVKSYFKYIYRPTKQYRKLSRFGNNCEK